MKYTIVLLLVLIIIIIHCRYKIIYYISLASPACPYICKSIRICDNIFIADSDMSAPANSLRLSLDWEKWMVPYIEQYSDLNATAIDIGAHIGVHTISMANNFLKVIAFEPNPTTYEMLKMNVSSYPNIIPVQKGVGNHNGNANFIASKMNCQSKVVSTDSKDALSIMIVKLDDYIDLSREKIAFIKIDVEGYEIEAFKGMDKLINTHKPVIVFEDHTGDNSKYLASTHNYKITKINKTNYIATLLN